MFTELVSGLRFPESPRWHDGYLWFSEKRADRVVRVGANGPMTVVEVPAGPGGLGWSPTGELLIVSMADQRLVVHREGALEVVADLSSLTQGKCNDMVVDSRGRAYVGDFGYELGSDDPPALGHLVLIDESGDARVVADELGFPNGAVVTPDGATLIVAESSASRLTAFSISQNGSLSKRRVFAELGSGVADGICLDQSGAVWFADPLNAEVVRVKDGGEVLDRLSTGDTGAFACTLGGREGRTLFVCLYTKEASMDPTGPPVGSIVTTEVAVPGSY